jgi:alpha-galactosidase
MMTKTRKSKLPAQILRVGIGLLTLCISTIDLRADDASAPGSPNEIWVASLDLGKMRQDFGRPQVDKSIGQHPISIGKVAFGHGIGTHANSSLYLDLHNQAQRFSASVGVDDDAGSPSALVRFKIYSGDNRLLWKSSEMKTDQAPESVDLDLRGVSTILLLASAGGGGINFDHCDWADAKITFTGKAPVAIDLPRPDPGILTPPAPATPRINGPEVFGVRPNSPFLYTVPVSGKGPFVISAENLPGQLSLDATTGRITGQFPTAGRFSVVLHAKNDLGTAEKHFQIIVKDRIRLTPPMGWNSWNCWGDSVSQEKVLISAKSMVDKGLRDHGWSYINIDDGWQGVRGGDFNGIQPNKKFPDMKALADTIHSMGLHFGIYSTPWQRSYASYIGSSCDEEDGTYAWIKAGFHDENFKYTPQPADRNRYHGGFGKVSFVDQDVKQWAAWGIDYLKYDWHPIDVAHTQPMSEALATSGRDIVYSLSNGAPIAHGADWARLANCWRTGDDIFDNWTSMIGEALGAAKWTEFAGPGHYNDPDMLVVGRVGWGKPHPTGLTRDEQYTHVSLWCLLSAPLLIGCDMGKLDDFTLSLLTNDEVLALDQDPLCRPATLVRDEENQKVFVKTLADGSLAVGLVNMGLFPARLDAQWKDFGLSGQQTVRDLWRQKDLGTFDNTFETTVDSHGIALLKISPASSDLKGAH